MVTQLLQGVVEGGTGTQARIDGISVAGKTGTAQKVEHGRYSARDRMSSFVGFVPADAPRFVILVVIDSPRTATYGGIVAAPVFRQIAEYGLDRLGLRFASASMPAVDADPRERASGELDRCRWRARHAELHRPEHAPSARGSRARRLGRAGPGFGLCRGARPAPGRTAGHEQKARIAIWFSSRLTL